MADGDLKDVAVCSNPRILPAAKVLVNYLARAPIAHALFRASELQALGGVSLIGPVLDLGCGEGEFVDAAVDGKVNCGIDVSPSRLRQANHGNCYMRVDLGDARRLPYGSSAFATVISISALEHMENVPLVIAEVYRVLRPGGRWIATVVLDDIHRQSGVARGLRLIGLSCLAKTYLFLHDCVFAHVTLWSKEQWIDSLGDCGFVEITTHRCVPPRVLCWHELFLLTAWPHRICMACGVRWFGRPQVLARILAMAFRGLVESESAAGVCLLIRATKPKSFESS